MAPYTTIDNNSLGCAPGTHVFGGLAFFFAPGLPGRGSGCGLMTSAIGTRGGFALPMVLILNTASSGNTGSLRKSATISRPLMKAATSVGLGWPWVK